MNQPAQKPRSKMLLFMAIFFALFLGLNYANDRSQEEELHSFTYSQFIVELNKNNVQELLVQGNKISGTIGTQKFETYGPVTEDLLKKFISKKIKVTHEPPEEPGIMGQLLFSLFPILILVLLFVWISRRAQGGGAGPLSFTKAKTTISDGTHTDITFADVAGVDEAKEDLKEIVDFLQEPGKFTSLGAKIPKGVLMIGQPGTGKTLLAKAVANEAGVPFLSISGSDFVEMFVGVGASRVRDLFETAKKNAPCIIFIDEIDAVGRQRGAGMGGGNDEREQTLNQLLVEMDGFNENRGIIVIAATNRVDVLDPAILRPGRFDRQVYVQAPDVRGREAILKIHTKKIPLSENVDLSKIAKGTPGFTGADLENLVNEAALLAARESATEVTNTLLDQAKDKVVMGPARKSMVFSDKDKEMTAFHEVGHALVAKFTEGADPIHKITIMPRGRALGVTMLLPEEDKLCYTKKQILAMIDYAMGGRAAEELIFKEITTGASDDIKKATNMARQLVCEWGMSDLGPINLKSFSGEDPFVGRDYGKTVSHSEDLSKKIDATIQKILTESYARALSLLKKHKIDLEKVSQELIERETLLGSEIEAIINGDTVED